METKRLTSLQWGEARRLHALKLREKGWRQCTIAEALGVSEAAVSKWCKAASGQGLKALYARHRTGASSKLTDAQKRMLPDILRLGTSADGFRGNLWNCTDVAKVIEQVFGVTYHPHHVARLLKRLDLTAQERIPPSAPHREKYMPPPLKLTH